MTTQFIRISDVPAPIEMGQARAFAYHTGRYHRWVKGSGASPRVAVFLCNDELASHTFFKELETRDIDVEHTEVSSKRVIPESILRHQGNHFNRRLFVVHGLDDPDLQDVFGHLDRYVDHYAKVATWVGFVIKDPQVLYRFRTRAPMLWSKVQRVVPIGSTIRQVVERKNAVSDGPECILYALNGQLPTDYYGWSRWMRSGYGHDVTYLGDSVHQSVDQIWRMTSGFQNKTRRLSNPMSLADVIHRRHLNEEIDYPFVRPIALRVEDRALCDWIEAMHGHLAAASTVPKPDIEMLDMLILNGFSHDLFTEAYLASAHAHALEGDLDGMLTAFERAVDQAKKGSPEVLFEVYARQVETFILLERHLDARRVLSVLETVETTLMSPFYEARLLALKGRSLSLLDTMQGDELLDQSRILFAEHGYPTYAVEVDRLRQGDTSS